MNGARGIEFERRAPSVIVRNFEPSVGQNSAEIVLSGDFSTVSK